MNFLSYLSGEFLDKTREKEFAKFFFADNQSLLRKNLIIAMIVTLTFIVTDYIDYGFGSFFTTAVILRTILALICYSFLMIMKYIESPEKLQNTLFLFTLLYVLGSCILFYLVPYAPYSYVLSGMLIVLAFYVFLPQRFNLALTISIMTSLLFLLPIMFSISGSKKLISEAVTYFLATNVFGLITFRELNRYKRSNFLMLKNEQIQKSTMQAEIDQRKKLETKLREQVSRDYLTGLYNRRFFYNSIETELSLLRRNHIPVSIIVFDLDHFKDINDKFGHLKGDEALKKVASVTEKNLRKEDILARIGGEEFAILTPGLDLEKATLLAERLRLALESIELSFGGKVSGSFGVVEFASEQSTDIVMHMADLAMYKAKKAGRNNVFGMV